MLKKILTFICFSFLFIPLGCSTMGDEIKGITGVIIDVNLDEKTILVNEYPVDSRKMPELVLLKINEQTKFYQMNNEKLFSNLKVGYSIETWYSSQPNTSSPIQATASKIKIVDLENEIQPLALQMALTYIQKDAINLRIREITYKDNTWDFKIYDMQLDSEKNISIKLETY